MYQNYFQFWLSLLKTWKHLSQMHNQNLTGNSMLWTTSYQATITPFYLAVTRSSIQESWNKYLTLHSNKLQDTSLYSSHSIQIAIWEQGSHLPAEKIFSIYFRLSKNRDGSVKLVSIARAGCLYFNIASFHYFLDPIRFFLFFQSSQLYQPMQSVVSNNIKIASIEQTLPWLWSGHYSANPILLTFIWRVSFQKELNPCL